MVRNTRYVGWYKKDDELVNNMFPALISQSLFDRVQEKLPKSRKGKKSNSTVYLLRKRLVCGYCGQNINGESGTSHNGIRRYYYKCRSIKDKLADCPKTSIPKDYLENQIMDLIKNQLSIPKNKNIIVDRLLKYQETNPDTKEIVEHLLKQKEEVSTAIKNIMSAIEKGFVCNSSLERIKELEEQQKELEKQIKKKEKREIIKLTKNDISKFYEDAIKEEPEILIQTLIEKIIIYNDKKEIYFNNPLKDKSPDDNNQDFLFYLETISIDNKPEIIRFYL